MMRLKKVSARLHGNKQDSHSWRKLLRIRKNQYDARVADAMLMVATTSEASLRAKSWPEVKSCKFPSCEWLEISRFHG